MFRKRPKPATVPDLVLYKRPGCHLCDEVQRELAPFVAAGEVRLEVVDLSGDAELEALHGQSIPVLAAGGRVLAKGRFRVADALARLRRRGSP